MSPLWVNFRKRKLSGTNILYCKNKIKLKRLEPTAADRGSCASIPVRYSPPQPSYSPQAHTTQTNSTTPAPKFCEKKIVSCLMFTWCDHLFGVNCCLQQPNTHHTTQPRNNSTLWGKNAPCALSFIQNNQETPPTLVAGLECIPISISQKQLSVFVSITSSTANSTPGQMQLSGRSAPQTCTPLSFTQNQRSTPEVPASLHFFFFTLKKGDFSALRIKKYSPKTSVCTGGLLGYAPLRHNFRLHADNQNSTWLH